jgi:hypothetical protein
MKLELIITNLSRDGRIQVIDQWPHVEACKATARTLIRCLGFTQYFINIAEHGPHGVYNHFQVTVKN